MKGLSTTIIIVAVIAIAIGIFAFYQKPYQILPSGGLPPRQVGPSVVVTGEVVSLSKETYSIKANITVIEASSILGKGETIEIIFSGIGDVKNWKAYNLATGDKVKFTTRFVENSYWEVFDSDWELASSLVIIESISPSSGTIGTEITIRGLGFTATNNDIAFTSDGIKNPISRGNTIYISQISSSNGKSLLFTLPDLLGACAVSQMKPEEACPAIGITLPKGNVQISVINKNGRSNSVTFTVE